MKNKYKIDKELTSITKFKTPFNKIVFSFARIIIGKIFKCESDEKVTVKKVYVDSFDGKKVLVNIIEPKGYENKTLPGLVFYHGGGFVFGASSAHYKVAKEYAVQTPCRVIYPDYRLAPKYPFPIPFNDCFEVYKWTVDNQDKLKIIKDQIYIGGDSAGGNLAATVTLRTINENLLIPKKALLIYPVTDRRMITESMNKYIDTPVWDARLTKKMWKYYLHENQIDRIEYVSPVEASSFEKFPSTYIEVAEYDCLKDEGILFYNKLVDAKVDVKLEEIKNACHGFETAINSKITINQIKKRSDFLR